MEKKNINKYLILLFFISQSVRCQVNLTVAVDGDSGTYSVGFNGENWLFNAHTFFRANGQTFSTSNDTLLLTGSDQKISNCELGVCTTHTLHYSAGTVNIDVQILDYTPFPFLVFKQSYTNGAQSTRAENCQPSMFPPDPRFQTCFNYTIGGFPSFRVNEPTGKQIGYLNFGDKMFGDYGKQFGMWNASTPQLTDGIRSGPLALFDKDGNTIIISPLDNFMTASFWHDGYPGGTVNWGIMGGVNNIPSGFTYSTILFAAAGIKEAFQEMGMLLKMKYDYDPGRREFREADRTLHYLGYWTDNGAYYYYNPEQNKTYEETIKDVYTYSSFNKIPYKYLQLDSWWYSKGFQDGVKQWSAKSDVFPNGIKFLSDQTNWPIAAHNRYWSNDTVYAKDNGGSYNFAKELLSLPLEQKFWNDLFTTAKSWNLILYEQDWLNIQTEYMISLQTDLKLGENWLHQMGEAAVQLELPIQYCMALPRHGLQSMNLPAVTQIRVSEDYHLQADQWKIGVTSILADMVGLAPFKDTFWTTKDQPGNPKYPSIQEPYPSLEAVVATLSTGPVGPGDKIGSTDIDMLMRCCNSEGLILQPSRPARAIDKQIIKMAMPDEDGPVGEVWTTYSTIHDTDDYGFGILLAADMKQPYNIYPKDTGFDYILKSTASIYDPIVMPYNDLTKWQVFNDSTPLQINNCNDENFCLYYFTVPRKQVLSPQQEKVALIGELNKWVPMSPLRVKKLSYADDVGMKLVGQAGENVTMTFLVNDQVVNVTCTIDSIGTIIMDLKNGTCSPEPIPIIEPTTPNPNMASSLRTSLLTFINFVIFSIFVKVFL